MFVTGKLGAPYHPTRTYDTYSESALLGVLWYITHSR